jgi:lipopolysaccharide heptosyltransferase I
LITPNRILIVRLSAIGDVVHVLPALAALRQALPRAHIAWLVEALSAQLLEGHPLLDELIVYPRTQWRQRGYWRSMLAGEMTRFMGELRRRRFDVAIDFQGLTKSAVLPWVGAARRRIGYGGEDGREMSRWFYTERVRPPREAVHVVQRNLSLLAPLGIESAAEPLIASLEFPFPDYTRERERLDAKLEAIGIGRDERFVAMNPGAGWETKRWPPEHYGALAGAVARACDCRVVLTWGPGEEAAIDAALAAVDPAARDRVHRAPATTLRELATLLDRSLAAVGGDTGPIHLAAARGVPVVALYGGSDPKRNRPVGPIPARVLDDPSNDCYPCWRVRCKAPPPPCLESITPDRVLAAVREAIGEARHAEA